MSGPNRSATQVRRASKAKVVKEKFMEERDNKAQPIVAKTENQKLFLKACATDAIVVGRGSAGVGKTYLAASVAANKLLKGDIDKIVMVRPYVQMGRSSGFWPGSIQDRMEPYFAPMLNVFKKRLGEGNFNNLYGKSILIQPMEAVRGMDFENTLLLADEMQNCTKEEMRCLVTRISEGSQFIFIGDDKQSDIKAHDSGLLYLVELLKKHSIPDTSVVEFTSDDVVRHGLVSRFVKIFDEEGPL